MFKKECCKQYRHVKFKDTNKQQQTRRTAQKHTEHQGATDIQNFCVCVFRFFYFYFFNK